MTSEPHPWLHLRFSGAEPLYEQIKTRIREAILRGDLSEGEAVPTFRKLAADLRVSLITVKRAYDDLSAEGVLQGQTGRGTYVAPGALDRCRKMQSDLAEEFLELAVLAAKRAGMTNKEIRERVMEMLKNSGTSPP